MNKIEENIKEILDRDNWICQHCGAYAVQVAHRISKSKINIKRFGKEIIHHAFNLAGVCCLYCNSRFNIENNPEKKNKLIQLIKNSLKTGKPARLVDCKQISEYLENKK